MVVNFLIFYFPVNQSGKYSTMIPVTISINLCKHIYKTFPAHNENSLLRLTQTAERYCEVVHIKSVLSGQN